MGNLKIGNNTPMNFMLVTGSNAGILIEMKITKLVQGVVQNW
jgi:hypothetical protein